MALPSQVVWHGACSWTRNIIICLSSSSFAIHFPLLNQPIQPIRPIIRRPSFLVFFTCSSFSQNLPLRLPDKSVPFGQYFIYFVIVAERLRLGLLSLLYSLSGDLTPTGECLNCIANNFPTPHSAETACTSTRSFDHSLLRSDLVAIPLPSRVVFDLIVLCSVR